MNIFFIPEYLFNKKLSKLLELIHYQNLSFGDVIVYNLDSKLIMAIYSKKYDYLSDLPIIAQIIDNNHVYKTLRPILMFWDQINERIGNIKNLNELYQLFQQEKIASQIIKESIEVFERKRSYYSTNLLFDIITITQQGNSKKENNIQKTDSTNNTPLLIVERFFTEGMKKQYYNLRNLGHSEREALVLIRRKFPTEFNKILKQFYTEFPNYNIYTKLK